MSSSVILTKCYTVYMRIYFSGISGTGIGPLAEVAYDAGNEVLGSDIVRGAICGELEDKQIDINYGPQDGEFLRKKNEEKKIDWLVQTSALPKEHAEIKYAKEQGIHISKRDEFLSKFIEDHNLKMIGVAGTHGKTTTVAMIVWAFKQMGIPVSYIAGTTLGWDVSGKYDPDSEYFIYEADEYDRNFLAYHPYVAAITYIDYDHKEIYPTPEDYRAAFDQFMSQSKYVVKDTTLDPRINLVGALRRQDASMALEVMKKLFPDINEEKVIAALNDFPGAGRRFERISDGVFSDYAHHPTEIMSTIKMALELKEREKYEGLAIVYQPLQNIRQYNIRDEYKYTFVGADKIYWIPTFLIRDYDGRHILTPEELFAGTATEAQTEAADMNPELEKKIKDLQKKHWLVLVLAGGDLDFWLRKIFKDN